VHWRRSTTYTRRLSPETSRKRKDVMVNSRNARRIRWERRAERKHLQMNEYKRIISTLAIGGLLVVGLLVLLSGRLVAVRAEAFIAKEDLDLSVVRAWRGINDK